MFRNTFERPPTSSEQYHHFEESAKQFHMRPVVAPFGLLAFKHMFTLCRIQSDSLQEATIVVLSK